MEPSAVEIAVVELAASFSEMTEGDLALPAGADGASVGELYRRAVERTAAVAGLDPAAALRPSVSPDPYGAGYDAAYRRVAAAAVAAATNQEADALLRETLAWARAVDAALGLEDL